jgi:nucleoside-triphosphatase THEP1
MFRRAADNAKREREVRKQRLSSVMRFGIEFLDKVTRGILFDDLVLIGAPTGIGKTQLCCLIAQANINDGKTVHYIALEAGDSEIDARLKFPLVMKHYEADIFRPEIKHLNYPDWLLGKYLKELEPYEDLADEEYERTYKNLHLYYKQGKFGINELIESVGYAAQSTQLIIIDHVHYFDYHDDNENKALKEIAQKTKELSLEQKKPIVLVAHLRKRNSANGELVPGNDEFMGSSDLTKVATRAITIAPGPALGPHYETYFRVSKNRIDNGSTRFIGREIFDPNTGGYLNGKMQVGWSGSTRESGFEIVSDHELPYWAR